MEANQDYYSSIMADSRNMIIKGKRTKRPRPSSPLSLTMASTSSTTTSATTDGDTQNPNNTLDTTNNSIEFTKIVRENDEEEEEEEDMAQCLILLAQSQSGGSGSSLPLPPLTDGAVEVARMPGFYVYECKTCNRGFSSFQALGGHRASHKKPSNPNMLKQDMHDNHSSIELSLKIGSSQMSQCNPSGSIKVTKIHICSICSAEFGSGQALGGHMRRHRSMPVARTGCDSGVRQESKKPKHLLSLDLNLPAPVEDDHPETKFRFRSQDQMIVFSNSSLVHCHI